MTGLQVNLMGIMPELIILATAMLALLADLFLKSYDASIAYRVACVGLVSAAVVNFFYLGQFSQLYFQAQLINDDMGQLLMLFMNLAVLFCFLYSHVYLKQHKMPIGDYCVLGLLSTLGMLTLVSAHSLLTVYLGLELLSLPLYAMTAMQRTNGDSSEAALKYFVMGAMASGMLLYGMSLLYGATGQLDLTQIATAIAQDQGQHQALLRIALVFILAGIGFKLAAMPFHMWAPDVYAGAPSAVTMFLSAAPKLAAAGMLFRLLLIGLPDLAPQWQPLVLVLGLLSAGVGNLLAIVQTNIKRLFAYSAISHMGYFLLGIIVMTKTGYSAALYYVLVYSVMSVAAFGFIVLLSCTKIEIINVDDLTGLNQRNPWLALMMMIILFSLAGVPPTAGFFAKLLILKALVDAQLMWVALLALVFAVIGAFYYLRIIKIMYFDEAKIKIPVKVSRVTVAIFSANSLLLLYWGIFPVLLINACMAAFIK